MFMKKLRLDIGFCSSAVILNLSEIKAASAVKKK